MIYDYYCLDCGNKFSGGQISFDLAEFLGLRETQGADVVRSKTTQISVEELAALAKECGNALEHEQVSEIFITLDDLLIRMGKNAGGEAYAAAMKEFDYDGLEEAIQMVLTTRAGAEVAKNLVSSYSDAIRNRFTYTGTHDSMGNPNQTERLKFSNYKASFFIKPEFFEGGRSRLVYTMQYSWDKSSPNMTKIVAPTVIRGYCPTCGEPIIDGAGKYKHILIGLLGAQSAGKTTTIVAMMNELWESYDKVGLKFPSNPLCDSKFYHREENDKLYKNGWAVRKTAVNTSSASFNASLQLTTNDEKTTKIISFIDIAGEQCYDLATKEMNHNALKVYPLINSCDLYLLCTCIDQTGYGNASGEIAAIPPEAVVQIARNVYQNLRDPRKKPPLCILMTKYDLADNISSGSDPDNPFKKIKTKTDYLYKNQIENLSNTYDHIANENVRKPLRWCCKVYEELSKVTYTAMLSCSALGRAATKFEGSIDDLVPYKDSEGKERPFARVRMNELWKWILQVCGLCSTNEKIMTLLEDVPSYGEHYALSQKQADDGNGRFICTYPASRAASRCEAVKKLFIKVSDDDQHIITELAEGVNKGFFGIGRSTPEDRISAFIKSKLS